MEKSSEESFEEEKEKEFPSWDKRKQAKSSQGLEKPKKAALKSSQEVEKACGSDKKASANDDKYKDLEKSAKQVLKAPGKAVVG